MTDSSNQNLVLTSQAGEVAVPAHLCGTDGQLLFVSGLADAQLDSWLEWQWLGQTPQAPLAVLRDTPAAAIAGTELPVARVLRRLYWQWYPDDYDDETFRSLVRRGLANLEVSEELLTTALGALTSEQWRQVSYLALHLQPLRILVVSGAVWRFALWQDLVIAKQAAFWTLSRDWPYQSELVWGS